MVYKRFPRKSSIRRAKSILEGAIGSSLKKGIFMAEVTLNWKDVVGQKMANYSMPLSFEEGVLHVSASSPGAAHQINMIGGRIARKIEKLWGVEIKSVKARVGKVRKFSSYRPRRHSAPIEVPQKVLEEKRKMFAGKIGRKDAEEALSRLSAIYEIRFGKKEKSNS